MTVTGEAHARMFRPRGCDRTPGTPADVCNGNVNNDAAPDIQYLNHRVKWLVKLRWIAIISALVLASAARAAGYIDVSPMPAYCVLGFSALGNLIFSGYVNRKRNRLAALALIQIMLDQVILGGVLAISGACLSPFLYFFLFHVVISGTLLPYRYTAVITGLAAAIPGIVAFLSHSGILPQYDIFSRNPARLVDGAAFFVHGAAFLGTLFLTAYLVIYLNRRLYQSHRELQRTNQKLSSLVSVSQPSLHVPEIELVLSHSFQAILNRPDLAAHIIIPDDERQKLRCYEYFTCSSSKCPAYHSDATCWHLLGTLCARDDARLPERRGSVNSIQCPHSDPVQRPARTYDDKMRACTRCGYFAHVIAAQGGPGVSANTRTVALSCSTAERSERESIMLLAMRDGQRLLQEGRRPHPPARMRTDALAFPLTMQGRLSGLLMITSRSELVCTDDALEFIRLLSRFTSTGLFGTSLFEYLETSYLQTVMALANAVEAKDPYTRGHSERVAFYSIQIGIALNLTKQEKEHLSFAAILHDIGKIGTNMDILQKRDRLVAEEQDDIKDHPVIGARILGPVHFLKPIIAAIRHHHENYDGSGYPSGLKGADIPLKARIVKIADAWDAMTSDRAYRKALSRSRALEQLARYSGTQFDPELVEVFMQTPAIQAALSSPSG